MGMNIHIREEKAIPRGRQMTIDVYYKLTDLKEKESRQDGGKGIVF